MQTEITIAQLLGPATADRDLEFFLSARLDEPSGDEQEPAPTAFGLGVFLRHDEAHEQRPQVVNDEQQPRRQFRRSLGLRAEAAEAPLVFEFVEHVLGVGALAV